ncbi:Caspase domain-containing protein [Fibrobacter sp. UWT3]|uniref:caspase family protein n=1 Tax=Fibrobacter sp. UWT3 TaxID=1896225 RepID=UPI000BD83BD2|nr:caspase family protein [Fibrobacter sp. UWT3]SOE76789.1 Caspase domain-containing protein [Fibrobacter sp. UWT3]SOE80119.1 Caspase domain-containing protein [Fibrobacter sp. UWT3]
MRNIIEKLDASITLQVISLIALLVFAAVTNTNAAMTGAGLSGAVVNAGLNGVTAIAGINGAAPQGDNARINRYVVAVSANYGGQGRPVLRYAESDAKSFAKVLGEMGGVQAGNVILVKEPGVAALQKQLDGLDAKIAQGKNAAGRNEVLFYYSGHADEKGLRLGNEVYAWKELRKRIDAMKADVKIAVIDACGSGAITRLKGGVAVPAFMVDQSSDMKGYAFITSSTQDESSQESDKLRGSFFTHSLVSGLRGAGDLSGDGKVTLSEAYQFAFNETLQRTEKTMGGAQHPSRDMNLAGTGDVVMTDLRSTSAGLELDEDVDGRLFIRDANGELVAELYKKAGRAMSLGFPAGKYTVRLERPAEFSEAVVTLQNNRREKLSHKQFAAVSAEQTTLRGEIGGNRVCSDGDTIACSLDSLDHNGKYRVTFNAVDSDKEPRKGIQIGFFVAEADDYMLGTQLSLIANVAKKEMHGLQVTDIYNGANAHFEGAQISGMINYAQSFDGAQIASTLNIAGKNSTGAQVSGTANFIADSLNGAQVSPALNYAGQADVQVTAALNIAGEAGVQVDAAMNIAGESDVQVTAALNIAGTVEGAQVSTINIAGRANGRQVGIINICGTCESTPIGLINIVGNGVWSVTSSVNEMGALGLSLHLGTAYLFTAFEGTREFEKGSNFKHFSDMYEMGLGLGTQFGKYGNHFELEYMFLNAREGFSMDTDEDDINFHHRLRLGFVHKLFPGFGLTVGGTVNVVSEGSADKVLIKPRSEYHDDFSANGHNARWWPGFYAGLTVGRF